MGLSNFDKYVPVAHFKDRLNERHHTEDWKSFMSPCFSKMERDEAITNRFDNHQPTQPRMPPISIGGGIGEQRGENKRILFTLN